MNIVSIWDTVHELQKERLNVQQLNALFPTNILFKLISQNISGSQGLEKKQTLQTRQTALNTVIQYLQISLCFVQPMALRNRLHTFLRSLCYQPMLNQQLLYTVRLPTITGISVCAKTITRHTLHGLGELPPNNCKTDHWAERDCIIHRKTALSFVVCCCTASDNWFCPIMSVC